MHQPDPSPPDIIAAMIRQRVAASGATRSIDPAEVARALAAPDTGGNWRALLGAVRRAAVELARRGEIEILRKGKPVAPDLARGVIRLRLPPPAG